MAENARRLLRFFYFERRLAQAMGAWTLAIPEFEVKLETGRHLFYHADAARAWRERLHEQEKTLKQIDEFRDPQIDGFIDEMLSAADSAELLVGLHQVAGAALVTTYRHHIDDTDAVTDAPTIRLLRRILLDYEPMLAWADEALAAYVAGGIDESRLAAWRWHLQKLLASLGGIDGAEPTSRAATAAQPAARFRARDASCARRAIRYVCQYGRLRRGRRPASIRGGLVRKPAVAISPHAARRSRCDRGLWHVSVGYPLS